MTFSFFFPTAKYDGLYKESDLLVKWSSCC